MSAFSAGSMVSTMVLDGSNFSSGMQSSRAAAQAWPAIVAASIDAPLQQAATVMGQAASRMGAEITQVGEKIQAVEGKAHIHADATLNTEGIDHGMLSAEATLQLFPALVIEFIENPLIAAVAAGKEALESLSDAIGEIANHFKEVNFGSIKSGLDPETFSTFSAAAKASGVEIGTFTAGLELLQDRAANALRGDEGATKGFKDLGISAGELKGLLEEPKELLLRVADAMAAIETPGKRVQAAMESMGRGGKEMLPFLQQGSAGIMEMADGFGKLGSKVDESEAALGGKFAQVSQAATSMWEGIKTAFAAPVLEYFSDHLDEILPKVEAFTGWLREGIGSAMTEIIPIAESVWGELAAIGDVVGSVMVPVFDVLKPVLEVVFWLMKAIADLIAGPLEGLAAIVKAAAGLVTGDQSGAEASVDRAGAAFNRFGQDIGLSPPDVKIENVNVNIDPEKAGRVAGEQINKHVDRAWQQYDREMKGDKTAGKVRAAMGNKRH